MSSLKSLRETPSWRFLAGLPLVIPGRKTKFQTELKNSFNRQSFLLYDGLYR